jgi:hypothetical protein
MHTYRFRILSDLNEDFVLDVEFKANQTFLDFHNAIKQYCNINSNEISSFYICDDKWRRKKEIVLIDMGLETDEEKETGLKNEVFIMSDVKLNQMIEEPHQRFIYVYDFFNLYTFYIELMKIDKVNQTKSYPVLLKKESEIQFLKKNTVVSDIDIDDTDDYSTISLEDSFIEGEEEDEIENFETNLYFGEGEDI